MLFSLFFILNFLFTYFSEFSLEYDQLLQSQKIILRQGEFVYSFIQIWIAFELFCKTINEYCLFINIQFIIFY